MNPYGRFIEDLVQTFEAAKRYQLGGFTFPPTPESYSAQVGLIFSPHPDDECITGGLPLRLLRELKMRIVNVAVTLGSNQERRSERYAELANACRFLGFELLLADANGLENITPESRDNNQAAWQGALERIVSILNAHKPHAIFFPHPSDGHSTHKGTGLLILDALALMASDFSCYTIETEYWHPISDPNLMVEISEREVIDLVTALSFHIGEVKRNPYHLTLPAWMIDSVRRGSELVGGPGSAVPDFMFATVYRIRKWQEGQLINILRSGRFLPQRGNLYDLLA